MLEGGEEEVQGLGEVVVPLVRSVCMKGGGYVEVEVGCTCGVGANSGQLFSSIHGKSKLRT